MATNARREKLRFTDGLMDYLQLVDYRLAESTAEKEKIYRFRYHSYLRENTIDEEPGERFCDDYDQMDNCWTFSIDYRDQLASSIRIHVATSENPKSPSLDVFPDIVIPLLEKGHKIVDPTRFVADSSATNFSPVLPFLTFRLACMASEYFEADYCLVPVSAVHSQFYQRIFGLTQIGDLRYYPGLKNRICLMRAEVEKFRDRLFEQYPVFRSTFTERRMLFEKSSGIVQGANDHHLSFNTLPGKNQLS